MSVPEEIRHLTEEVITSFGSGIAAVGVLIEKGLEILDGYRREEEAARGSLRESLATVSSLRKRDFDEVMGNVLDFQAGREREIKTLITGFLGKQKQLTARLKRAIEAGIFQEVERIKEEIALMIQESKTEILLFQKEQGLIRQAFATLEEGGHAISFKDFRRVIEGLERELGIHEPVAETLQQTAAG